MTLEYTAEQTARMFEYLDTLRESGETNMFGAAPYVESHFGMTRNAARSVLMAWADTFDPALSPAARAEKVASP